MLFWDILMHCTGRRKMQEKLQIIVNLPCLGYNTGKEEYTNAHLLVSAKDHELRGKNLACNSRKTNILDLELRVGSWNYMSASKQMKHSLPEIMHNSWKRVHKIWCQSLKLFQNGGHFQLPHVNLTRTGSNKVN